MRIHKILTLALIGLAALGGCVSPQHVVKDYQEIPKEPGSGHQTVIVILIDGLPLSLVDEELRKGRIPELRKFYISKTNSYYTARTSFPSLTFPAISSLLTEKPISGHGIYGNIIRKNGEAESFESPKHYPLLNQMIEGKNIFARLAAKGKNSVSFDYAFQAQSSVHFRGGNLLTGYAVMDKNYTYADEKTISGLTALLEETEPSQWPDFIFVHLIGVDLTAHDQGPRSKQVSQYLNWIDQKLARVFYLMTKAEVRRQRQVVSLLTSDHGFDQPVSTVLDLEAYLKKNNPHIQVLNEGRFAGLYFFEATQSQKAEFAKSWSLHPQIDLVVLGDGNSFSIFKNGVPYPDSQQEAFYPYFLSNLREYFKTEGRPEILLIPKPGVSFSREYRGQHGGPTPGEVFVPLLLHNATINPLQSPPALWELLRFL